MRFPWGTWLVLAVLLPGCLSAWEVLGPREGLSSSTVTALGVDRDGLLWLATGNGLDRWDGVTMKVWQNDPFAADSLSSNSLTALLVEDRQLWVGTNTGLDRFDEVTGRFVHFRHDDQNFRTLSDDRVTRIFRDRRGRLWVGTANGLNALNEATLEFDRWSAPSPVLSLASDASGALWAGLEGGLARVPEQGRALVGWNQLSPSSPLPEAPVTDLLLGRDDATLWAAVAGSGLFQLDPQSGTSRLRSLPNARISDLAAAGGDRLLVATRGGGLYEFDPDRAELRSWTSSSGAGSLPSDDLSAVIRDASGLIWVASPGRPVAWLDPRPMAFPSFATHGGVSSLFADRHQRLWMAVEQGGVHEVGSGGPGPAVAPEAVNDMAEDAEGVLWWATDQGLVRYDPRSGDKARWGAEQGFPEPLTHLRFDDDGALWLGTAGQGLLRHPLPGRPGITQTWLVGATVHASLTDALGRTWVGTSSGLARLVSGQPPRIWHHRVDDAQSLAGDEVRALCLDGRGRLWLATNGGLSLWDEASASFQSFGRAQGLGSLVVTSLVEDASGMLWMGTVDGLYRFSPETRHFQRFGHSDGLPGQEFSRAAASLASGDLVFGGQGFVTRFYPVAVTTTLADAPVALTGLVVSGQERPVADALDLGWQQNSVVVSYGLMEFSGRGHQRYAYKLEGFDADWVDAGSRREASYTNLPAGTYVFRVRGSLGADAWTEGRRSIQLRVEAAPWLRWYAWVGYVLVAASVLLLSLRVYADRNWKRRVFELESLKSQLLEANRKLDQLSRLDGLTGIPNRRALDVWMTNEWALAQRQQQTVALILLDIDEFKRYNDNYGHLAGDACLKQVADVLQGSLHRTTDFCARYGGEEFVVILHDTELEGARVVAERLLASVDELRIPHQMSRASSWVSISLGVAARRPDADATPADLIQEADQALYRAKSLGRHRVFASESRPEND